MKLYTVKNENGTLFPKAICEMECIAETVINKEVVLVDYGLEKIQKYLHSGQGEGLLLAICELTEI